MHIKCPLAPQKSVLGFELAHTQLIWRSPVADFGDLAKYCTTPFIQSFQTICAQCEKDPCCDWVGEEGAGHFVKMVHNGIEYGDMQLIAEAYHLMKDVLGKAISIRLAEMTHSDGNPIKEANHNLCLPTHLKFCDFIL